MLTHQTDDLQTALGNSNLKLLPDTAYTKLDTQVLEGPRKITKSQKKSVSVGCKRETEKNIGRREIIVKIPHSLHQTKTIYRVLKTPWYWQKKVDETAEQSPVWICI